MYIVFAIDLNIFLPCFGLSIVLAHILLGDPTRRPGSPQLWYWHGTVRQGSVRFNLTEEALPPNPFFLSSCTYSMTCTYRYSMLNDYT